MSTVDKTILEGYYACLPVEFYLDPNYSKEIATVIKEFYNLNGMEKELQPEFAVGLINACNTIQRPIREMVEVGNMSYIPHFERQLYAIIAMIMVRELFIYFL